ncbi:hypothetical protein AW40_06920 [Kosakonia radicincitans UMEnt01/12]|nr:hypothetical protein AW40_06920 [Kosakonia radicincitans UMEnt01/12]
MQTAEVWSDIDGYSGAYQISNRGRARSIKGDGTFKVLKPNLLRRGYFSFRLYRDKKQKAFTVHRLVALHFIPNPEGKEQVNHINGIKADNRAENLEWVTKSENQKHAFRNGLNINLKGHGSKGFKGFILAKDIKSGKEIVMAGTDDIRRNGFDPAEVYKVLCRNNRKSHKGHTFTRGTT